MKKQEWTININSNNYIIKILNNNTIKINDEQIDLRKLKSSNLLYVLIEYKLQIENQQIILSSNLGKWKIIIDGKDYNTNQEYIKIEDFSKWIYVFLILNMINLINGALGGVFAFFGIFLTLKVFSMKINIFLKLLLNILILLAMFGMVFGIVLLLKH